MNKKIVLIGHSYHLKTKSNDFFIDLLKKHYDITFIADETWEGKPKPDLSIIDETYDAIIFWQMISLDLLKKIKCKNIIFIPMYDQSGSSPAGKLYHLRNLKIVSFCEALGKRLSAFGFDVLPVKYFPEPVENLPIAPENTCFFWQRINTINWPKVKILLSKSSVKKVHIHKAIDPGHTFSKPPAQDVRKYKITYSSWFKNRESYLKIVDENQIYIAPRYQEGIGLSFLEAMVRGKVIVAADQPTMNEYIIDGYNGYLFDPFNVMPIDFSNIEQVKQNSLLTIKTGHAEWVKQESLLIDFINKPAKANKYFRQHPFARFQDVSVKNIIKTIIKMILPFGIVRFVWYMRDGSRWKRVIKEAIKLIMPYGILKAVQCIKARIGARAKP